MFSKRFSQLISLFAVISLSYFLASCGDGDGPTPVAAEPCPADGVVSFDADSYPSSATSALISVNDACIGRKDTIVNVDNGTESISIDLVIADGEGDDDLNFGATDDTSNTIAIKEGDVITVTYADANGVTRTDTASITASTALSTLGVYSETNTNPELVYSDIANNDAITDRFSQTVSALEGSYSLEADYVLPASGNDNGFAFTFFGLINPTFEADDASAGNIEGASGWTTFEFAFTNNTAGPSSGPVSHDVGGSQSLTMFGPFTFDSSTGAYQPDNNVVAGQSYTATAHVMNWAPDPLAADNLGIMQLTFWDAAGGQAGGGSQLGPAFELLVDSTDDSTNIYLPPEDGADISDWTALQITQTAPAGTVSAEIFLLHIQLNTDPLLQAGSIFWDDISLAGVKDLSSSGEDISTYETLKFGINTTAASGLMDLEIKMEDNAGATASVFLSNYTSLVVGDWALLEIPLSDFTGIDKTRMISLGFINASSTVTGSTSVAPTLLAATLYFDDVHFAKADSALTGVLLDSPVEGVTFQTTTQSGITNVDGEFLYLDGEMVTFSIGDIFLGTVPGAPIVTPVELTGSADPTVQAATNQLVFLQSIDEDENPLNGITISVATQAAAVGQSLDFTLDSAAFTTAVTSVVAVIAPTNTVVSEMNALDNFYQTYVNLGGIDTFNWLFPGYPPVPAVVSGANTTIDAAPASIEADGLTSSTITVQAKDTDGNNFTESAGVVLLSSTGSAALSAVTDNNDGTYTATVTSIVAEAVTISGSIAGNNITDNAVVTFTPGSVLETLGVYSETNINPVLAYSDIINAAGGNTIITDELSALVLALEGNVSLEADFQDNSLAFGGFIFDFTTVATLSNGGFELPDASGGDVPGAGAPWNSFNSNFTTSNLRNNIPPGTFYSPDAHSGTQLLKQFGTDAGSFQDLPASEGETWEASAWAQSWAGDPNNNTGLLQIFFRDANDNNLCPGGPFDPCDQAVFDTTQPVDTWVQLTASAVAPAGTTTVRIQLILVPDANTPANGSLFWDDASLTVANLLSNASFETPDASGSDVPGAGAPWNSFNLNFTTSNLRNNIPPGTFYSPDAHSGTQLLKQFGTDAGSFQDLPASEGEAWEASAWAQSWAGDLNNNTGLLQIFFRDANDNNLCPGGPFDPCDQAVFDTTQPVDTWVQLTASAVAPAGTTTVRIQLILVLDANTPANGSLFWDDASLSKTGASALTGGDIQDYETLKFGIDTSDIGTFADLKVQLEDGTVTPGVFLSDYLPIMQNQGPGGNWDVYEIPISDFTGLDKSNLTYLGFWDAQDSGGALTFGKLYFDDIHFIKGIPVVPVLTGVLLDTPVEGVNFQTATQSGITNALGEFQYQAGEMVTFSVGGIVLGIVQGAAIITPVEVTGSFDPTNQAATNQLVFLQSIDADEDPSNGITISAATQAAAVGQTLDFTLDTAAFTTAVTTVVNAITEPDNAVVSETTALDNFYLTYVDLGGTNTFIWLFPGYPQVGEPGYELIWSDEFNEGVSPSAVNWTLETGYGDNGWGNNEWQLYTTSPDNIRVESGNLVITADCPTAPTCGVRDGTITSGKINTLNKFEFKYGKVQARIKPAVGAGAWPAFWMLGANFPDVGWPFSGEIDVMEMHNFFSNEFTTHFTIHWCDESIQNPATPDVCFPENEGWTFFSQFMTFGESLGNDFHIFEAEWNSGQMIGKIDGITYFTLAIDPVNMDEFLKEFYMILNLAMGGTLGSGENPPTGLEAWPQTMLVDYVRVYQLIGGDGTYTIGGGAGPNLLSNASFETPDASGGDVPGAGAPWNSFNLNFTTSNLRNNIPPGTFYSPDAHSGSQLLKQFGTDAGSFQDLPASPGETWTASAWAQSWAGDLNNNTGLLQIFFRDANDNNLCPGGPFDPCDQAVFDTTQPVDTWVQLTASAVAPAGTTTVRIQIILVPDANTPANGALFWDDASLSITK